MEKVSEADRIEQASLERVVADAERVLRSSPVGMRPFFTGFLENAKGRLGTLQKKIHDAEKAQEEAARTELALASLAKEESALSQKEKETYSGFLKQDFFTKKDFGRLGEFYARTWDRLSDRGKEEMSHRIWEGIRRDEYKFSDLPQVVQEKEEDRAYAVLKKRETQVEGPAQIPPVDRVDFIRAYEGGTRVDAGRIFARPSFREKMFLGRETSPIRNNAAEIGKEAEVTRMRDNSAASPAATDSEARPLPSSRAKANLDASGVKLNGLVLTAPPSEVSPSGLPNAAAPKARDAQSLRGG